MFHISCLRSYIINNNTICIFIKRTVFTPKKLQTPETPQPCGQRKENNCNGQHQNRLGDMGVLLTLQSSSAQLLSVNFLRNEVDFNHAGPPELVDFDVEADVSSAQ